MRYQFTVIIALIVVCLTVPIWGLSCDCSLSPCNKPPCCKTGSYVPDPCHCCQECAKGEGEKCGGPWNLEGICGEGLHCYRSCQCQTKDDKTCVFPFKYKGVMFNGCTTEDSKGGEAWCGIEKEVINEEQKQICSDGCPGMRFPCSSSDLFNIAGICVSDKKREEIQKNDSGEPYEFDQPTTSHLKGPAPKCKSNSNLTAGSSKVTCRCSDDITRGEEGHCREGHLAPGEGWCFVGYIKDPAKPKDSCFSDVQWSESAGMFWSSEACKQDYKSGEGPKKDSSTVQFDRK